MASQLDHEVDDSLDDLRKSLDVARAAIARDPAAATQTQRDQLAANLRMLAGLEERAAAEVRPPTLRSDELTTRAVSRQPFLPAGSFCFADRCGCLY